MHMSWHQLCACRMQIEELGSRRSVLCLPSQHMFQHTWHSEGITAALKGSSSSSSGQSSLTRIKHTWSEWDIFRQTMANDNNTNNTGEYTAEDCLKWDFTSHCPLAVHRLYDRTCWYYGRLILTVTSNNCTTIVCMSVGNACPSPLTPPICGGHIHL